jgi:hypothetical protein
VRSVETREGRLKYPFYKDLTAITFRQLKLFNNHDAVEGAWTVSGTIRFRLKGKDRSVFKVSNIFETPEDFL